MALSFLAQMTFAKGDHARALALYHEALASLESVGDHPEIARVHCEMGWTALAAANARAAQQAFGMPCTNTSWSAARAAPDSRCSGSRRSRRRRADPERAVAIAAAAHALSERAGVVIAHPMDPGSPAGSRRSRRRSRKARWTASWRMRARSRRRRCWR